MAPCTGLGVGVLESTTVATTVLVPWTATAEGLAWTEMEAGLTGATKFDIGLRAGDGHPALHRGGRNGRGPAVGGVQGHRPGHSLRVTATRGRRDRATAGPQRITVPVLTGTPLPSR